MAISVIIKNPQNDFESKFYIQVAYLSFFERCWLPGIKALDLRRIGLFELGVEVTEGNLPIILDELNHLKKWAAINLNDADKEYFFENVDPLAEELPTAFQRKGAVVYIG
ncbi:hypothetical protein M2444_005587 [Paenibacillus sp. PastF-3]|uniref:hypothetical protein n=1 Tax=Paenibacillus sp. PastF-3 TaxID=2940626 RepID=UPI002474756C|nr:hypothetical protein [Paenibacillus sp. PastF-3]MDH6373744.1 hypothetical protein [Paenibacillus sp. PastF-3]